MSQKIVIVSSSPRLGGNSDLLCDAVAEGAKAAGKEVVKLNTALLHVEPCHGCDYCMEHGGVCIMEDDMGLILKELETAEAVVLATPVYFFSVAAQLKAVIDRCYAGYKRLGFKKLALIATSANGKPDAMDGCVATYKGFLRCFPGAEDGGQILATGVWKKGDVEGKEYIEQARELGRNL